jgi:hypothetical protein
MQRRDAAQLLEFLSQRLALPKDRLPQVGEWAGSGNTIGSIALRMGILDLGQIERVVDGQVSGDSRFGDTAVQLGLLSREQIDLLVQVQDLHRCVDLGAPLVMSGRLEMAEFVALVAEFVSD